jgi:hypothetical protein
MYIPVAPVALSKSWATQRRPGFPATGLQAEATPEFQATSGDSALALLESVYYRAYEIAARIISSVQGIQDTIALRKRQYTGSGVQDTNITIGIILGVVLGAFLIGVCAFCYTYRFSIRFTNRRRKHRKSSSSKSSKSSSDGGPPPPPPPPPPADA